MADSETVVPEVAETPAPEPAQPVASAPELTASQKAAIAANDAARVKAQNEAAQERKDKEAALARLAELEQRDMSELEKAQKERDLYKAKAAEAEAKAERIRLNSLYAHAVAEFEGEALPSEATLAALEKKLAPAVAAAPVEEAAPEPRFNPGKTHSAPAPVATADLMKQLDELGPSQMPGWFNR